MNKTYLITGGTGTIGQAVHSALDRMQSPPQVRIFSRDEHKQHELQPMYPSARWLLGDVRDRERLRRAMRGVDCVIHCAALKHVPACEYNPAEAADVNIMGTRNVIETCEEMGVEKCILVSTDKAVNPVSTMGATKLVAEKITINANRWARTTRFSVVRLGNVIGSRGSFISHIENWILTGRNGKIKITSPKMIRWFIHPTDVGHFILACLEQMEGGEMFVPCAMQEWNLLDFINEHFDLLAPMRTEIKIIGLRPGEKLREELFTEDELSRREETDWGAWKVIAAK